MSDLHRMKRFLSLKYDLKFCGKVISSSFIACQVKKEQLRTFFLIMGNELHFKSMFTKQINCQIFQSVQPLLLLNSPEMARKSQNKNLILQMHFQDNWDILLNYNPFLA